MHYHTDKAVRQDFHKFVPIPANDVASYSNLQCANFGLLLYINRNVVLL